MSNTAPSRADPVVVFPLGRWCPPQETSQPHPPPSESREFVHEYTYIITVQTFWGQDTAVKIKLICISSRWHAIKYLTASVMLRDNIMDIISFTPYNNRPIWQIPQCISLVSHSAPFCERNVHTCAHFSYKMVHCGIWDRCIVGFVNRSI